MDATKKITRTDRERIQSALDSLIYNYGYFAQGPFWCCGSCGNAGVPKDKQDTYVFWHAQNDESAFGHDGGENGESGGSDLVGDITRTRYATLKGVLYLHWSGDATLIMSVFMSEGFTVTHDGDKGKCIEIMPA